MPLFIQRRGNYTSLVTGLDTSENGKLKKDYT